MAQRADKARRTGTSHPRGPGGGAPLGAGGGALGPLQLSLLSRRWGGEAGGVAVLSTRVPLPGPPLPRPSSPPNGPPS